MFRLSLILLIILSSSFYVVDTTNCSIQYSRFKADLNSNQSWALQMHDAWGKSPNGVPYSVDYGNFDQCVDSSEYLSDVKEYVQGQNCMLPTQTGRVAVCLPAACQGQELQAVFKSIYYENGWKLPRGNVTINCEAKRPVKFTPLDWFAIIFFSTIAVLMVLSTCYEYLCYSFGWTGEPVYLAFAMRSNFMKIVQIDPQNNQIDCLNGIRVLSTFWIVLHHTYISQKMASLVNLDYFYEWAQTLTAMPFLFGGIPVDTFLLISGILVSWNFFRDREKGKELNLRQMYMRRYVRLMSAMIPIILFSMTLIRYAGSGPEYHGGLARYVQYCNDHWWTNFFHIQNYVNPKEVCVGNTWYIALDMQLFIIAPALLLPLYWWRKRGLFLIVLVLAISTLIRAVVIRDNDIYMSKLINHWTHERVTYLYMPTHTRMGPWLIGILLGFFLHRIKDKHVKMSKIKVFFGWTLAIATMIFAVFGTVSYQTKDVTENKNHTILFETFYRQFWAIANGWLIYACFTGYGGFINTFLSLPLWQPLAKLSYSLYLIQMQIQYATVYSYRSSINWSNFRLFHTFFGDLGIAILAATVWMMAFELPAVNLEQHFSSNRQAGYRKLSTN